MAREYKSRAPDRRKTDAEPIATGSPG